jgi:hypothetical protein
LPHISFPLLGSEYSERNAAAAVAASGRIREVQKEGDAVREKEHAVRRETSFT